MHDQGENSIPHLKQLILKQNVLIKDLQQDLLNEREVVKQLKQDEKKREAFYSKQVRDVEKELKMVQKLLLDNGIEELSQQSFDYFKCKIEEDFRQDFSKNVNIIRSDCRNEINMLEQRYEEAVNKMVESLHSKELFVEKHIEILSNAIAKVNSTYCSLEDIMKPGNNQVEMEQISKLVDSIKKGEDLTPSVSLLSQTIVDSICRETNIWKELYAFRNEYLELREGSNILQKILGKYEYIAPTINQFSVPEHSRDSYNPYRRLNMIAVYPLNEKEENTAPDASDEIDSLLNYTMKLNKYLRDIAVYYNNRLNKFIVGDANTSSITSLESLLEEDNVYVRAKDSLLKSDKFMMDLKGCHRLIFYLNEILKSFDLNFEKNLAESKLVLDKLSKLEVIHEEKVFSLESHIKLLNEKIAICLRENKNLETEITRIHTCNVPKEQFDTICAENKRNIEFNKKLEEEVMSLKNNQFMIDKETKINSPLVADNPDEDSSSKVVPLDSSDLSYVYENPLPKNVITSTPFHSKGGNRPGIYSNIEVLKSSLLEWIERCQSIESEKKQLENKLYQLNLIFNQTTITKNVLEHEIEILKGNIKFLKDRVDDYILLKERNHILENDNSMLSIKVKFLSEIQDCSGEENCLDSIKNEMSCVPFDLELFDSSTSKINFIHEFQKKNQLIIHLESQCRSKDVFNNELSLKLKQANEMERILENKVADLIANGNAVHEKLFSLIEENSILYAEKVASEIELKSMKDQLNCLISSDYVYKANSSNEFVEAMKNDTLKMLKDSIEIWSKIEEKFIDTYSNYKQVDRLDARHIIEILTKDNSLLKNDNEELLLKLSKLQHQVNALQNNEDIDEGWFLEMEKYERELIKELKEQREQHARIEEALRSTGNLHDELQKQHDLLRSKLSEISNLKKQLEEEKCKNATSIAEYQLIQNDIKDKEKLLQETLDEKQGYVAKLALLEKEFAQKEKKYQNEIMQAKWMSQYSLNKSVDSVVKRNINSFQTELIVGQAEMEKSRYESMDVVYQQSIESLRYLLQQDKEAALIDLSCKQQKKV